MGLAATEATVLAHTDQGAYYWAEPTPGHPVIAHTGGRVSPTLFVLGGSSRTLHPRLDPSPTISKSGASVGLPGPFNHPLMDLLQEVGAPGDSIRSGQEYAH